MVKSLLDIADIRTGYTFRRAINEQKAGPYVVLAKNVSLKSLYLSIEELPQSNLEDKNIYYLYKGDVLLTRHGYFRSAVYNSSEPCVASSSVMVIRLRDEAFLPEYIAIYLNSDTAQKYFNQLAIGSSVKAIGRGDIANIIVPAISIEQQRVIISLQQNIERQTKLLQTKSDTINNIFNQALNTSLKENSNDI